MGTTEIPGKPVLLGLGVHNSEPVGFRVKLNIDSVCRRIDLSASDILLIEFFYRTGSVIIPAFRIPVDIAVVFITVGRGAVNGFVAVFLHKFFPGAADGDAA